MAKPKAKPVIAADALKPYVQRAMTDPELREDLLAAFATTRALYGHLSNGKGVKGKADKVSDKDFQKDIQGRGSRGSMFPGRSMRASNSARWRIRFAIPLSGLRCYQKTISGGQA